MNPRAISWTGAAPVSSQPLGEADRTALVLRMARIASCTESLSLIVRATLAEMVPPEPAAGLIALLSEHSRLYVAAAESNRGEPAPALLTEGPTALAMVLARGRSLIVPDLSQPAAPTSGYRLAGREPARSLAVVPVRASRRVIGLLAVESAIPGAFTEDDLGVLEDIALAVSGALQAVRLRVVHERLDNAERIIYSLARAVEARDRFTEAHTERVARSARLLGETAGLDAGALDDLYSGGMIHDIGKIGIPDSILLKPGPLSPSEFEKVRNHPLVGADIVSPLRSAAPLLSIVRHHHERWDGAGYPDGLAGDGIPVLARIVAICDAFDAMISERPYRPGVSAAEAVSRLQSGAGSQWDPEMVALFVEEIAQPSSVYAGLNGAMMSDVPPETKKRGRPKRPARAARIPVTGRLQGAGHGSRASREALPIR
ncbi:MAG: HD-GYP domain-containing protein [Candidatus Dormibacterales bacterium]